MYAELIRDDFQSQSTKKQELNQELKENFEGLLSDPNFDTKGPIYLAGTQAAMTLGYLIILNPAKPLDLPSGLGQKVDERVKAYSK